MSTVSTGSPLARVALAHLGAFLSDNILPLPLDVVPYVFYDARMNRDSAIERYRVPLLGYVMELFAKIGLREGVTIERVSKPVYREVLGILRTAESAVRRLIIAAARDIVVEPTPKRPARATRKSPDKPKAESKDNGTGQEKQKRKRRFLFKLFDPPKRFKKFLSRVPKRPRVEPRVRIIDFDPRDTWSRFFRQPEPAAPLVEETVTVDDDTVDARHLIRRLLAITDALQDIPRQAMRYARWRNKPIEERHPQRESALRFGRPPGYRQRPKHEVDEILKECHWLARNAEPVLDTS